MKDATYRPQLGDMANLWFVKTELWHVNLLGLVLLERNGHILLVREKLKKYLKRPVQVQLAGVVCMFAWDSHRETACQGFPEPVPDDRYKTSLYPHWFTTHS